MFCVAAAFGLSNNDVPAQPGVCLKKGSAVACRKVVWTSFIKKKPPEGG
jgi:hypothetical protein